MASDPERTYPSELDLKFVLPARNEPYLAELPPEVRKDMRFVPADILEEVLEVALPR